MANIVITGSSKGLGKTLAEYFLDKGHSVTGLSRSTSTINNENYKHIVVDISKAHEVERALEQIDSIDVLINNAAVFEMNLFEDTENIDAIIDTNLKGSIYTTKYSIPKMSSGSQIIFINSVAGLNDFEKQSIYCASKHGLKSFAAVLGKELKPKQIRVTSIHPGGINTTLWSSQNPYPLGDAEQALDPKTIAETVYFVVNSPNSVDFKTITMFPQIENH
jgi:NADP-dependent 3-hydroxy acid dehydrogenase YdfG